MPTDTWLVEVVTPTQAKKVVVRLNPDHAPPGTPVVLRVEALGALDPATERRPVIAARSFRGAVPGNGRIALEDEEFSAGGPLAIRAEIL